MIRRLPSGRLDTRGESLEDERRGRWRLPKRWEKRKEQNYCSFKIFLCFFTPKTLTKVIWGQNFLVITLQKDWVC